MSERFACDVQQPLQEPSREKKAWEHTSCSGRELREPPRSTMLVPLGIEAKMGFFDQGN